MPELPDITIYTEALERRVRGAALARTIVRSPFLVRTFEPAIESFEGRRVEAVERLGKRIVFRFDDSRFLLLHLMIAGRLRWKAGAATPKEKIDLAALQFSTPGGTLIITEAGTRKRAGLWAVANEQALAEHDPGGIDPISSNRADIAAALRRENHTLKRALTDPRLFSGIGNAYSDEILHAARLSPIKLTSRLTDEEIDRLRDAMRQTLCDWVARLRDQFGDRFPGPGEVTAFRADFAAHGRFGRPCPVCAAPIQRIVRGDHETNYCARCQTGGKVLADRSLSRLLGKDWPRSIDEIEDE